MNMNKKIIISTFVFITLCMGHTSNAMVRKAFSAADNEINRKLIATGIKDEERKQWVDAKEAFSKNTQGLVDIGLQIELQEGIIQTGNILQKGVARVKLYNLKRQEANLRNIRSKLKTKIWAIELKWLGRTYSTF